MKRTHRAAFVVTLSLAVAAPCAAQAPGFQTAVPESPAFTFLGATPNLVSRPSSVRDLGAALLTGVNPEGVMQQGFALDLTPWIYIPGYSIPLDDYASSVLQRGLANLQLSVGTVATAGDSASTDFAIGLRTTLFDGTDPMVNDSLTTALGPALRRCAAGVGPGLSEEEGREKIQECADSVVLDAWGEYSASRWNASFLAVGIAAGARAPDSRLRSTGYAGLKTWIVGGLPLFRLPAQVLGQFTFGDRPALSGEPATTELTYGARLLMGSASFHAFVEAIGVSLSDPPGGDGAGLSWSGGLEFQLSDGMWASTGFGQRFEGFDAPERVVVLLGFNFGVVADSRVKGLRR